MPGKRTRAQTPSWPRRPRSLLGRMLGVVWRHPLLAGAALATAGWLLSGDDRRGRLPRMRRVAGESIPVNENSFNSGPAEGAPSHG